MQASPCDTVRDVFPDRRGTLLDEPYLATTNIERVRSLTSRRTIRRLPTSPGLSVVVLNLDRPDLIVPLVECAPAFAEEFGRRGLGFELLIGDTGSSDPAVLTLLEAPPAAVRCIPDLTYHFSRTNNEVADGRIQFDTLLLLNNDVLLRSPEPVLAMRDHLLGDPETGIVGAVLDFPDGRLQHAGIDLVRTGPLVGLPIHVGAGLPRVHRVGDSWPAIAATGAALMIRTDVWQLLGGLDESYTRECQDVDLCLRAHRLGRRTRIVDVGRLVHEENGTRPKGEEDWADRRLFLRRWWSYLGAVYL